jgi:hypothetical protein
MSTNPSTGSLARMVTDAGHDPVHSDLDPREIEARLDALERASDERRAELSAVLDDLPAALSRRALLAAVITDARAAPQKRVIVTRGVRKLGRMPAAAWRRARARLAR